MCSGMDDGRLRPPGFPIGNPRIKACVPLPEAYRSLPRPSFLTSPRHSPIALGPFDSFRIAVLYTYFPDE